jgi:O-antigen/teichoic acid export membrane protein
MIRDFIRHSAAYTFANLFSRGTVVIWLLVLPAYLSIADYGALGVLTTVGALFNVIVPLEVTQALARYAPGADQRERRELASSAWKFTLAMTLCTAALGLALCGPLTRLGLGGEANVSIVQLALVWLIFNCAFYFVQAQQRWEFRSVEFVIASLIFSIVTLTSSLGLAAAMQRPLAGVVIGQALGAAAGFGYGFSRMKGSIDGQFSGRILRKLLAFSLPLVPASLAIIASTYANRLILVRMLGLEDVGLFTWATQLAAIPSITVVGIQAALTPLVMKNLGDPATPIRLARWFETIFAIELCICVALVIGAPFLIALLGYRQFSAAPPLVALAAPGLLFLQLYVFFPGFAVARRTDLQLVVSLISGASVLVNFPLIGWLGVPGAALGTMITGGVFLLLWYVVSNRFYPVPLRGLKIGAFGAAAAVSLYVVAILDFSLLSLVLRLAIIGSLVTAAFLSGLVDPALPSILIHGAGASRLAVRAKLWRR